MKRDIKKEMRIGGERKKGERSESTTPERITTDLVWGERRRETG
jgi:hypothetical protein